MKRSINFKDKFEKKKKKKLKVMIILISFYVSSVSPRKLMQLVPCRFFKEDF